MVPWHPPCALCSLIFSSLILRPIVVTLFQYVSQLPLCPILRIATGLCSKSFSVQLSRYSSGPGFQPSGSRPVSPENDTEPFSQSLRQLFHNEALASFLWNLLFGISTRQFLAFLSSGIPLSIPSVRSTFGSASAFLLRLSP